MHWNLVLSRVGLGRLSEKLTQGEAVADKDASH